MSEPAVMADAHHLEVAGVLDDQLQGVVEVSEPRSALVISSTEKRRPFTATIFMPVETPASNAGRPGQASSTVGDLTLLQDGKRGPVTVGRRNSNSLA